MRKNRLYMIMWQTLLSLRDNREVVSSAMQFYRMVTCVGVLKRTFTNLGLLL